MICEQYKLEVWTNVYTDGSAANAVQVLPFTSLVAAQKQPVQQHEYTTATTKQRHWWWQTLLLWTHNRRAPWLYFSLMRSQFYKPTTLSHLEKALQLLSNNCRVRLQWIPAQCGVPGNEQCELPRKGHHYQSAYDSKSRERCLPPS